MLVLKWSRDQHGLQRVRQASATETHQDKGGLRHRTGGGLLPSPALGAQGWRPPAGGAPAPQEPGLPPAPETPVFIRDPRAPARSPLTLRAPSPHPSPPHPRGSGLEQGRGSSHLAPHPALHTLSPPTSLNPSALTLRLSSPNPVTVTPPLGWQHPGPSLLMAPPSPRARPFTRSPCPSGREAITWGSRQSPSFWGSHCDNPETPVFKSLAG